MPDGPAQDVPREHPLDKAMRLVGLVLCVFVCLFTFYTITVGQFPAQVQRGIFLLACGVAVFCLKPFRPAWKRSGRKLLLWANRLISLVFAGLLSFAVIYIFFNFFEISAFREGLPNAWDLTCYTLGSLAVLEGVRRTDGWPLLSVILAILAYLFLGHLLPGALGHQTMDFAQIMEMCFGLNGVFGVALAVTVNVIYIFIIFGAILRITGAGDLFIDLAFMLTGRFVGGPAQSAVVASALFGSISGSGPANVVSTGSFTIPLMKRTGYQPEFAGAVEATASCVGQIMPPVMGVGAFIMSEITGIPYGQIMVAALVPSILYSLSLLVSVRLRAQLKNIAPVPASEIPRFRKAMIPRLIVLLLGIGAIVYQIVAGQTPDTAGLTGAVVVFAGSFLVKEMRPTPKKILAMLIEGGRDGLSLTMSCAGIGIIIGGISVTGLGVKFGQAILSLGQANLILALIMAAFCCLIIGMGLPTAASYLMVVFIAAPAITKLGLPLLTAHMFIFYYAVLSAITPPVALCAYAASGIAQSDPLKTGMYSVRLAAMGFFLPFLWIYNPELMLQGGGFIRSFWAIGTCALATAALGAANIGFFGRRLKAWERIAALLAAAALASHLDSLSALGLAGALAMYLFISKTKTLKGVQA